MWTPYLVWLECYLLTIATNVQILHVIFFLDVRICVLVPSKIKLSVSSTLNSAETRTDLRVSSISIFRGPTDSKACMAPIVHVWTNWI